MEMQELEKNIQVKEVLYLMANNLDIRECDIIISRYVHNMTYREIAEDYDISKSRVMQILAKSMRKLHKLILTNAPIDLNGFSDISYEESSGEMEIA
jgi:RNA polymerase sigma factor (sigma-70 family)